MPPIPGLNQIGTLPKVTIEFGTKRLIYDVAKMTPAIQSRVKEAVAACKAENSLYTRVEMNQDEDHGEYLNRASLNDPALKRHHDELPLDHAKRIMVPQGNDSGKYAFNTINALSHIFGQPEISWEDFENKPLHDIRIFVFNTLNFCDCPLVTDFAPKRLFNS